MNSFQNFNARSGQVYNSQEKIRLRNLIDLYNYRFLIVQMIRRDILTRYKRSVLGVAWTMLNPLGTMIILTIVFSNIFNNTTNYPVYVLTGIMAWNFFTKSTNAAMNNMVWGGQLLGRIFLPPTIFSFSAIGTELINLVLSIIPLSLVLIILQFKVNLAVLFLPISIFILSSFSLGLALLLSRYAIFFPDVSEMYQILLTAWMYMTPVIFPLEIFPEKYKIFLLINPMTWMVKIFRAPIYEGRIPNQDEIVIASAWGIAALIFGWILFNQKSDEYSYRV